MSGDSVGQTGAWAPGMRTGGQLALGGKTAACGRQPRAKRVWAWTADDGRAGGTVRTSTTSLETGRFVHDVAPIQEGCNEARALKLPTDTCA